MPKRRKLAIVTTDVNLSGGSRSPAQIVPLPSKPLKSWRGVHDRRPWITTPCGYDEDGKLKYDAMIVVQPSTLSPPQLNNLVEAMKAGQPTVILEDPFPLMFGQVVGTSEDKPSQGGMMGMGGPPQPKGDSFGMVWKTLGIEPLAEVQVGQLPGKIVARLHALQVSATFHLGPFVFVRRGDAGTLAQGPPSGILRKSSSR